jgi:hypothetical protein
MPNPHKQEFVLMSIAFREEEDRVAKGIAGDKLNILKNRSVPPKRLFLTSNFFWSRAGTFLSAIVPIAGQFLSFYIRPSM